MEMYAYGIPNGIMCWWVPVENAAVYHVNLYVDYVKDGKPDQLRIKTEDVDRNTLTHSFVNLAKLGSMFWVEIDQDETNRYGTTMRQRREAERRYHVEVEAEDRDGNVIDVSWKEICDVK